jgi:hypothetical protein
VAFYRLLEREIKNKSNATAPRVTRIGDWELQTRKLLALLQERLPEMPPLRSAKPSTRRVSTINTCGCFSETGKRNAGIRAVASGAAGKRAA